MKPGAKACLHLHPNDYEVVLPARHICRHIFRALQMKRRHVGRPKPTSSRACENVMSSSAELKARESHILQFLRRFRNGWGIILLTFLFCLYLTGFYHHNSIDNASGTVSDKDVNPKHEESSPSRSFFIGAAPSEYQDSLPGSVNSDSKTFDVDPNAKISRDANTLPGAIGLGGSFDEYEETEQSGVTGVPASKEGNGNHTGQGIGNNTDEARSATMSSFKASTSEEMVPTGEEKSPKISMTKKKKKRRKKSKSTTSSSLTKKASSKKKRKKRKKRRRKYDKETVQEAADSSPTQPGESQTKSLETLQEKKTGEKSEDDGMTIQNDSGKIKTALRTANETSEKKEPLSSFEGPRPMDRKMEELQVPAGIGLLDEEAVKGYYGNLVNAYLAPFAKGISRTTLFKVLRRKTYSLSPPGSNKGVQTILFQLIKSKLFLLDPYEVMKNSKPFYKTRVNELIWLLSEMARSGKVPDTEFLVAIHDCVQTVNADHTYRGAVFKESNPTFTIVSCNFSDNIPIPMWEGDPVRGGLKSWDKKMEAYKSSANITWSERKEKAVFRGGNRPSMFFRQKNDADQKCDDAGRSRLSFLGKQYPDLFDVSVSGRWCGTSHSISPLSEADHHQYKYILYAEGNCFWADRLNKQIFGPSAIIKQETPCGQFWEPLLKPMTHYIPTDFFFQDTVDRIKWAKEHDDDVQSIIKNANEFAGNFLNEKGIKIYVEVLLKEYTKLLSSKVIEPEKGANEVTAR